KSKEYSDAMEKEAKAYTKAQVNQAAIDSYKPAMFETATSSAAAATASTVASAAAGTASAAASSK
ncbi:MAG TPA: hypothetical protein VHP54_00510, partial [Caproiciproducens sp.]|nr:hypothetical protein [Caproiciproducens sp.]